MLPAPLGYNLYVVPSAGQAVPASIPDGAGDSKVPLSAGSKSLAQQPFFMMGQLGRFLTTPKVLFCPKDLTEVAGSKKNEWAGRSVKLPDRLHQMTNPHT